MSVKPVPRTEFDAATSVLLALDDSARQVYVREHPDYDWTEFASGLADRVREEIRVDTARAQQLADLAIVVSEAIGNQIALAKSLRAKANALYALDQHASAIELHKKAAAVFEAAGDEPELARTLSGSIQPLLLLGYYDQALAAGARARELFAKQGNTLRLARLDINIGNIYHRQDRFSDALVCYERAYHELAAQDDAEGLAAVMSNLPLCYMNLNEFPRALEMYQKAREYCQQKGMPILVAYADYNIAYLYYLRGEFGRAIQMLREAAQSGKKANDAYQIALCSLDLSEIYIEVNLIPEASELAREANEHFQRLGFGYEAAKALVFAAVAASKQGQAFEGIKLFSTAKELFLRDKNHVWPSLIDLYEALVLFNEGRLFEARRLGLAARDFFSMSAMRSKAILAELLLARIALRMADFAGARTHCQAGLDQVNTMESPTLVYQAEFLMGEVERTTESPDAAYECYRRARAALETLRGNLRGEELKIAFFQNKLEVYENLVDLCLTGSQKLEEAFEYIQLAKSRSLMDRLMQPVHVASERDAGQSDLVRSIRNLREELSWYYNLIEREQLQPEARSPERIQKLEQEARAHEDDLMHALREATLDEANRAGVQMPSALSLERIRSVLPADTALVEYFRVQDRDVACVLTRDDLQIRPVTMESRVKKTLQLFQFQLAKFRLDPKYVEAFQEPMLRSTQGHLASLYQELIAPIADLLQAKHLVFAPHGLLHHIPFHALYDGENYLTDKFSVSYAPSASVYALCREKAANPSGTSLILGIADAQAPLILEEVEALGRILPDAKLFVGEAASEAVLRTHGPTSKIVHIATHGYFRQDNPMFSSIRLGDSYLSLYDLYHFTLPAELVVLSGCATGRNTVTPGDELMGLVRGLLQAGAQSLLLSLWDVHDASTRDFMIAFYSRLAEGIAKPQALQLAMAEIRRARPHPYYWAPFSLIGKG
ncbi:MAG TPA: CHAT domain-containing protein [Terriglobales bacterium]|nr:CHAT domain-containing protein [Terriglobales bacterium]